MNLDYWTVLPIIVMIGTGLTMRIQRHLGEVWKPVDEGPILVKVGGANLPADGGGAAPSTSSRSTVRRTQDRFGYSCSAARECATEAIFCCPTENSRHLEALLVSKDALFKNEKESARTTARCHLSLEKSSKNYIPCESEPSKAATHSVLPPTS